METIGDNAFQLCSSLASLTIGEKVKTIGDYAFADCPSLVSVNIPNSVSTIGQGAFYLCTNLANVTFEQDSKLKTIGINAFFRINLSNTKTEAIITIPQSVLNELNKATPSPNLSYGIGKTFFGASNAILVKPYEYYTIVTNSKVYYLPSFSNNYHSYYNTNGTITGNDINNLDVSIDDLTAITAVTIGPSVTSIGDNAFGGCTNLASVNIPDSVTEIGENAFSRIGENNNGNTIITISQSTVRRLMESDNYYSGNEYTGKTFFSDTTTVTLNVT